MLYFEILRVMDIALFFCCHVPSLLVHYETYAFFYYPPYSLYTYHPSIILIKTLHSLSHIIQISLTLPKAQKKAVYEKAGLPIVGYFSASKIRYLLDTVPGLAADAESGDAIFGTIDTWLLYKLSGGYVMSWILFFIFR